MEPLHPEMRILLKKAHPGLSDEDIDRTEELLAQRMLLDSEKQADRIAQLDVERVALIEQKMPHYRQVLQTVRVRPLGPDDNAARKVTVTVKKAD